MVEAIAMFGYTVIIGVVVLIFWANVEKENKND